MVDIYLNPFTKDIDFEEGFRLTTEKEEYVQRTLMALKLNLAEFFSHTNYGLPWLKNPNSGVGQNLRYFLGDSFPNPEYFLKGELDRYIKRFDFVDSIVSDFSFSTAKRTFTYNVRINTKTGEEVIFPPYITTI